MQQIISFLLRNRYLLLFLLLEIVALILVIQNHSYHKSKIVSSSNAIVGNIYTKSSSIKDYFSLTIENQKLAEENAYLRNLLSIKNNSLDSLIQQVNDTIYHQEYNYIVAKVINNNYSNRNNHLTINKGHKHGIYKDMGVILPNGVMGVVKDVSSNFATIISILHEHSKINVGVKNSNHFGTMVWDGRTYEEGKKIGWRDGFRAIYCILKYNVFSRK